MKKKNVLCILWLFCLLKEIYEFIICEKTVYSCFLLITLLASVVLFMRHWLLREREKTERKLLNLGIAIFAVREVVVMVILTSSFIKMLPHYTNPFLVAVRLYVGVLLCLILGYVTWMQKDV